jgi:hypothetical protein
LAVLGGLIEGPLKPGLSANLQLVLFPVLVLVLSLWLAGRQGIGESVEVALYRDVRGRCDLAVVV